VLAGVRLAPSDSDRRRFFARLHDRAAELGVDASALTQAIANIRERLAPAPAENAAVVTPEPEPATPKPAVKPVRSIHTKR